MTFQTWIAFSVAAGIVLIIPGPTIITVISHSLAHGRRAVIALVLGVTLGDLTAMTCSLLGLGAILALSATLFAALKLLGAFYLIYLGVKLWRTEPKMEASSLAAKAYSSRSLLTNLFVVTALNPKSIVFFIAFLPQFVTPSGQALPQLLVLGGTFLFLGAVNATLYALFAGHLRERMQNTKAHRWFNRCGGTALIGAGFVTATMRQSS
ncbi:MAG: lysine transporter LysE [Deltaproteobacteria bacterium RBG_19FT_COMBO_52_11]|jgi:threonine/homoserine/homoserine lactone efflux protein|nr:MAG: lysine transporter LysE [Deltaproteobacteria bacterium RBG_19FT_COMBO_52_11]